MLHTVGDVPGGEQLLAQLDLESKHVSQDWRGDINGLQTSCKKNLWTAS